MITHNRDRTGDLFISFSYREGILRRGIKRSLRRRNNSNMWKIADFLVDRDVVAAEVEISQFDEISESAVIHRADVVVGQPDVLQIGESCKSADYNVGQFVSVQSQSLQLRQLPKRFWLESADLVPLKIESLQTDQVAEERPGDARYSIVI